MRRRKLFVFVGILAGLLLGPATPAGAETLGNLDGAIACGADLFAVQTESDGTSTAFTSDATVTSFSVPGSPGDRVRLVVVRPTGGGSYLVVGTSETETLTTSGTNTFPVTIAVSAGDHFGAWKSASSDCGSVALGSTAQILFTSTPPSDGDTVTPASNAGLSFALQVETGDILAGIGPVGFDVEPTTLAAEQVTSTSALLRGRLVVYTAYRFEYGLTDSYGETTREMPQELSSEVMTAVVRNLQPGTTYHYRIVHRFGVGEDMTFTTRP